MGDPVMVAPPSGEDFLLFLWKRRKVKGLRCLKESLLPSGGVLTRFSGRFWGAVSGGCFRISGIFAPPRLRPVRNERRLGSHGPWADLVHHAASFGAKTDVADAAMNSIVQARQVISYHMRRHATAVIGSDHAKQI